MVRALELAAKVFFSTFRGPRTRTVVGNVLPSDSAPLVEAWIVRDMRRRPSGCPIRIEIADEGAGVFTVRSWWPRRKGDDGPGALAFSLVEARREVAQILGSARSLYVRVVG